MKGMKKTAVVLSTMLMILAAADCIAGEVSTESEPAHPQATSEHIGEVINILINEEPVSSPRVQEQITGGECVIAGDFTPEEAQELAEALDR